MSDQGENKGSDAGDADKSVDAVGAEHESADSKGIDSNDSDDDYDEIFPYFTTVRQVFTPSAALPCSIAPSCTSSS
jgi:hypothetical protein